MTTDVEGLRRCPLFADLPEEQLDHLAARVQHREYDRDAYVFHEGDPGNAMFIIEYGEVVIGTTSETDKPMILATLGRDAAFGELALLDGGRRSASAQTTAPTRLLVMHRDDFLEVLDEKPAVSHAVLASLAGLVRRTNRCVRGIDLGVGSRIARVFLALCEEHGEETPEGCLIVRSVPMERLAARARVYREETEIVVRDLQFQSIIQKVDDQYLVRDRARLASVAGLPERAHASA